MALSLNQHSFRWLLSTGYCLLLLLGLVPLADLGLASEPTTESTSASSAEKHNSAEKQRPINFENDIVPILTKFGCNASGCQSGQMGQASLMRSCR